MINQSFVQKQQFNISPQQIQLLNIFFLNSLELEARISNELQENPFLENKENEVSEDGDGLKTAADEKDFQDWDEFNSDDSFSADKLVHQSYISREDPSMVRLAHSVDFREDAKQQLRLLEIGKDLEYVAMYVIDMLNDKGLLDISLEEIAEQVSFLKERWTETEFISEALSIVQTLDPIGIGSVCIKDCLLRQLKNIRFDSRDNEYAYKFIANHYDEFISHRFDKIHKLYSAEQLKITLKIIGKLNFHPVSQGNNNSLPKQTIIPDYIISVHNEMVSVRVYSAVSDSIFINQTLYDQLALSVKNDDKPSKQFLKSKLRSAQWFVNAVKQREETMLTVMNCIAKIQNEYFVEGEIEYLKPMTLKDVAAITGFDLSTISRITSRKYAQVHFGIIHLKSLFSEGMVNSSGEIISNKVVRSAISDAIASEDRYKPYTDQQVVDVLSVKGYKLARRTVTKYRRHLAIPTAQVRHMMAV